MNKLLVLCALCSCALGSGTFPPYLDNVFHFTEYWGDNPPCDSYVVQFGGKVFYSRDVCAGKNFLLRCDNNFEGKCFVKISEEGEEPECVYTDAQYLRDFYFVPFDYKRSTAAACPDGVSTGCMNYTNAHGDTLTADSKNRIVIYVEDGGSFVARMTYHDDVPTADTFADTDCEGDALADLVPFGTFTPKDLGCAFSFNIKFEDGDQDIRGFKDNNGVQFLLMNYTGYQGLIRCDADGCYSEQYAENFGGCIPASLPNGDYIFNSYIPHNFGYIGEPESVSCSEDGPAECMKYTSATGEYIIVDSQDHIVIHAVPDEKRDFRVAFIEYRDEEPSIDIFNNLMCNTTALPPAKFTCPAPPPSSSSKPVDPSSSTKPVDPSSKTSVSQTVSSSSLAKATISLVVAAVIVAVL